MERTGFDDIVRNLLVFLKGQVPSLQAKTSRDDVIRQIQSISYMLRTSIIQLEGAAYSDPKETDEYKRLVGELTGLKQTNQRLEESLFLEMGKTQRLKGELDTLQADLSKRSEVTSKSAAEIEALKATIKDLESELEHKAKGGSEETEAAMAALKNDKIKLEEILDKEREEIRSLKESLQKRELETKKLRDALQEAMKMDKGEIASLKEKLAAVQADKAVINDLNLRIKELEEALAGAPSREMYQNNITAAQAKIDFLEKALMDARRQAGQPKATSATEQAEVLQKEKLHLSQRVIDLEATLRRLMSNRAQALQDTAQAGAPRIKAEEYVFFFEVFSAIRHRLLKSPENKDVLQKSEEAISILERAHAIQSIATTGFMFDPKLHKVVKSFYVNFLEDGTVVYEVSKGFKGGDHVIQRAVVWISKSRFICTDCKYQCKQHENFCPKCGLELCGPDGTAKRNMPSLPTDVETAVPLLDALIARKQISRANSLFSYIAKEHPDHPGILKRGNMLSQISIEEESNGTG